MNLYTSYKYSRTELSIKGENGAIYALCFSPEAEGKLPAVVLSHGYNASHADLLDYAQALAAYGFVAVAYDFCGGSTRSKSEGSSLDMSLMTEVADLRAVVAKVKVMPNVNPDRVFLYGESQGGCVSALLAGFEPNAFAGMALLYPALCIPDDWRPRQNGVMPETMNVMGMTLSRKFADELPDFDIYEHIAKYERPVLLLHGDADGLVNIAYSERAEKCLKKASLAVYSGEGHGFSPRARAAALGRLHSFLAAEK